MESLQFDATLLDRAILACCLIAIKEAQLNEMCGDKTDLFLFMKRPTLDADIDLKLLSKGSGVPDGYDLVTTDRLTDDTPYEMYFVWIKSRLPFSTHEVYDSCEVAW